MAMRSTDATGRTGGMELSSKMLDHLQDLTQYNIDSYNGLNEAAEKIDHEGIASLFRQLAPRRQTNARELQQFMRQVGEEPKDSGSASAAAHRAWINLRAAINGGDPYVILIESERGEDMIKNRYEDAMQDAAGHPVHDLLRQQYEYVRQAHDQIRDLRDSFKKEK